MSPHRDEDDQSYNIVPYNVGPPSAAQSESNLRALHESFSYWYGNLRRLGSFAVGMAPRITTFARALHFLAPSFGDSTAIRRAGPDKR